MSKQAAYFGCKFIAVILIIQAVKAVDDILDLLSGWYYIELSGKRLVQAGITAALPMVLYALSGVILWRKAAAIAARFAGDGEPASPDFEGLLRTGIALLALYSAILDAGVLLWELGGWFGGTDTGSVIDSYVYGYTTFSGMPTSVVIAILVLAVSLLVLFKAGWIARKLCASWERERRA